MLTQDICMSSRTNLCCSLGASITGTEQRPIYWGEMTLLILFPQLNANLKLTYMMHTGHGWTLPSFLDVVCSVYWLCSWLFSDHPAKYLLWVVIWSSPWAYLYLWVGWGTCIRPSGRFFILCPGRKWRHAYTTAAWNPGALSKNTKCPPCKVEPSRLLREHFSTSTWSSKGTTAWRGQVGSLLRASGKMRGYCLRIILGVQD